MITRVAGAGFGVHWQGIAGVTQQALAVLLIVSPQMSMNVAIQCRVQGRVEERIEGTRVCALL